MPYKIGDVVEIINREHYPSLETYAGKLKLPNIGSKGCIIRIDEIVVPNFLSSPSELQKSYTLLLLDINKERIWIAEGNIGKFKIKRNLPTWW